MKFLLLSPLILVASLSAQDLIEKAIFETDLEMLSEVLSHREPLRDLEKLKYLDLAQQMVSRIQDRILVDTARPPMPLAFALGLLSLVFLPCMTGIYFEKHYRLTKPGAFPILLACLANLVTPALMYLGFKQARQYYHRQDEWYKNALRIKQMLYEA